MFLVGFHLQHRCEGFQPEFRHHFEGKPTLIEMMCVYVSVTCVCVYKREMMCVCMCAYKRVCICLLVCVCMRVIAIGGGKYGLGSRSDL